MTGPERVLRDHFSATASQAQRLEKAGHSARAVAEALKEAFSRAAGQVAQLLKDAGFGCDAVLAAVVDVFSMAVSQAVSLLTVIFAPTRPRRRSPFFNQGGKVYNHRSCSMICRTESEPPGKGPHAVHE